MLSTERVHLNQELVLNNPRIQRLRRLIGRRSARAEEDVVVVEGEVLIREAMAAGWRVESQFVVSGEVPIAGAGEVHFLAPGVMEKVASTESARAHLAVVLKPQVSDDVLRAASFVVLALEVGDPGNLGTMIRSAEAAGAQALVVTPGTVDWTNTKVIRASAGSVFRLPVFEVASTAVLHRPGRSIMATSSHHGEDYTAVDLRGDLVLVLGNEVRGVQPDPDIDRWLTIPLAGSTESLNVAMACTVLCFEVARQRRDHSGTVGEP